MPQANADQFASIPMSPNLGRSLERAKEVAREQSHRALLLEHLLLALTEDPEASAVLQACKVDLVRLGADVSNYLGRLPEDMRGAGGAEPAPDQELLRVLEAARQAGAQSRRKLIDGSIVLAAVVGDGKSPAAGLLKTHGMTFEEAIRALQKASAQARSKQYAAGSDAAGQAAERPAPAEAEKPVPAPVPAPARPPEPPLETPVMGQSVDEILAAARARIQQRSQGTAGKPQDSNPPAAAKTAQDAPETLPLMSLQAFQASQVPPAPAPPDLPPRLDSPPGGTGEAFPPPAFLAPPPPPGFPAPPPPNFPAPPPQSLQARMALQQPPEHAPPPPRPSGQPPDGLPPALPQPQRGGTDGSAPPRLPGWGARAPRSDPDEPPPPRRPPPPNGRLPPPPARRPGPAGGDMPAGPRPSPARPPQGALARTGQRTGGPLVETIPRQMRVGVATPAQVRIGRDKVDGLVQLLMGGRSPHRPDAVATQALTVRLRAPEGGFAIEALTPETQWVEAGPGEQPDEPIGWRWTVTPQRSGRRRLQLLVDARTVGRDGSAFDAAPPDRVIDVAVRGNGLRRAMRWLAILAVLAVAGALGRYGQELWEVGPTALFNRLVETVTGLLAASGFIGG